MNILETWNIKKVKTNKEKMKQQKRKPTKLSIDK